MKLKILLLLVLVANVVNAQNISIPSNNLHSGGTYSIYRSASNNTITIPTMRKAVIWVEGFETLNGQTIVQNYNTLNFRTFATSLHNAGYDIVILNFNYNNDDIKRNAKVLKQLIQNINAGKPNNEPLVIMGYSMGGLIARYALVEMENSNIDHETRLYISYDSPHKGAHIPVSVQALALTFNTPTYRAISPELGVLADNFASPAAKQMIKFRLATAIDNNQDLPISPTHLTFLNEINNLNSNGGFPQNCQSVAVSLGSWTGIPQRANFDSDNDGLNDF